MITIDQNIIKHLEQAAQKRKRRARDEYQRQEISERELLQELAELDDALDRFRSLYESKAGESE